MIVTEGLTTGSAKQQGISELQDFSPSPALDVSCLLCHLLNCDKTYLLMHHKEPLSPEQAAWFCDAVEKRKSGLPVAYITNHKEFYGYDFYVTPAVLIPKPDTEILVENAVASITEAAETFGKNKVLNICDMCSGSGCIGISVYLALLESGFSKEFFPNFTFVDISPEALQITKHNANHLIPKPVSNLRFVQSNLFENVTQRFDFVLTNPPYVPAAMVDELLTDGRREPRLALDGDNNPACVSKNGTMEKSSDGLGLIKKELPQMFSCIDPWGQFLMETGEYNAEETAILAEKCGFKNVSILRDLEGQKRVVTGRR